MSKDIPDEVKYPDRYAHFARVYEHSPRQAGKVYTTPETAQQYLHEWYTKGYTGDYVTEALEDEGLPPSDHIWNIEGAQNVERSAPRADLLDEAKSLITGDRNNTYGPPTQDFRRSAEAMTAMGYRSASGPIRAHDVAILVTLVKISRLQWSPEKRDHWADIAGYSGCGYECTTEDE